MRIAPLVVNHRSVAASFIVYSLCPYSRREGAELVRLKTYAQRRRVGDRQRKRETDRQRGREKDISCTQVPTQSIMQARSINQLQCCGNRRSQLPLQFRSISPLFVSSSVATGKWRVILSIEIDFPPVCWRTLQRHVNCPDNRRIRD